jgi:hypothetical protein
MKIMLLWAHLDLLRQQIEGTHLEMEVPPLENSLQTKERLQVTMKTNFLQFKEPINLDKCQREV